MPIHWTDYDNGSYVEIKATGTVIESEWLAMHDALLGSDEKAARIKHVLSDWTGATDVRLSSEAIRRGALMSTAAKFSGRLAVVASQDVVYGLARMWEGHVELAAWPHAVFKDHESAKAWLRADLAGETDVAGKTEANAKV